jgi:glycosyltransferase involved in cell wall biosynthesis
MSGDKDAMSRLSIAHVHTALVGSGGDRVSELEACYLAAQGHRAIIVGDVAQPIASRLDECGVALVDGVRSEDGPERVLARTGRLDIVHCHCILSAPFAAALASAGNAALIVHVHSMGEAWWECTAPTARLSPKRRQLRKRIDRAVASAKMTLCVSEVVRDHMSAIGLPIKRAEIIRNPIDNIFFRDEVAQGPMFDVAILARPSRAKSPIAALRILARAQRIRPDLRMVWIGPLGRWGPVLRSIARVLGVANLHFAGAMSPERVCDLLDRTRVLLSASNREGQPLSVLEALSRGCSVLLSDIPSHRPFARNDGARLFQLHDLSEAAAMLIKLAEAHVRRPSTKLDEHRVRQHGERILEYYRSIL